MVVLLGYIDIFKFHKQSTTWPSFAMQMVGMSAPQGYGSLLHGGILFCLPYRVEGCPGIFSACYKTILVN